MARERRPLRKPRGDELRGLRRLAHADARRDGVDLRLSYRDGFTGWNVDDSGDWNYFPEANVRCVR